MPKSSLQCGLRRGYAAKLLQPTTDIMTLERLKEIFPQENITTDTTVGELIDLADNLSLEDSHLVEWDEVDAWLTGVQRTFRMALYTSIGHYLTPV